MASRGMGGSGVQLAAQLSNSQNSANQASQNANAINAQAQNQALAAVAQQGGLATQMQGQSFGQQAATAQAQNAINQFNAANTQNVAGYNTGTQNQAQAANLANAQNIANTNTGLQNQQQAHNTGLYQTQFGNQMQQAGAEAGVQEAQSGYMSNQAAQTAGMFSGIGAGAGTMLGAATAGPALGSASNPYTYNVTGFPSSSSNANMSVPSVSSNSYFGGSNPYQSSNSASPYSLGYNKGGEVSTLGMNSYDNGGMVAPTTTSAITPEQQALQQAQMMQMLGQASPPAQSQNYAEGGYVGGSSADAVMGYASGGAIQQNMKDDEDAFQDVPSQQKFMQQLAAARLAQQQRTQAMAAAPRLTDPANQFNSGSRASPLAPQAPQNPYAPPMAPQQPGQPARPQMNMPSVGYAKGGNVMHKPPTPPMHKGQMPAPAPMMPNPAMNAAPMDLTPQQKMAIMAKMQGTSPASMQMPPPATSTPVPAMSNGGEMQRDSHNQHSLYSSREDSSPMNSVQRAKTDALMDAMMSSKGNYSNGGEAQYDFRAGGHVPGKEVVPGDSPKNDTVNAKLSPGEIVVKKSVAQSGDADKILNFVKDIISKKKGK